MTQKTDAQLKIDLDDRLFDNDNFEIDANLLNAHFTDAIDSKINTDQIGQAGGPAARDGDSLINTTVNGVNLQTSGSATDSLRADGTYAPVGGGGGGVQSISGDGVDNTDPANPVLSFPDADSVDDSSTTNKFATAAELSQIGSNASDIVDLQNNKLSTVSSNDTLTGLGTVGSPLGVQQLFALRDSSDQTLWRSGQTTEGLINQSSALEDYFGSPLVFTAARDTVHGFATSLTWSLDSTTVDIIVQLEISGDQGFSKVFTLPAEPTDSGGGGGALLDALSGGVIGGQVAAGTTQVYVVDVTRWFELTAGETYTVTLRWAQSGGGTVEAAIYNSQLAVIERFGAPIS